MKEELVDIKTELLCNGVCIPENMRTGRRGGAGPAGGRYMVINGSVVNVPVYGRAVQSPFVLKDQNGIYILEYNHDIYPVQVVEPPLWYTLKTDTGISYKKIALQHGVDCLATTVYQRCCRWRENPCAFCGIELSLEYGGTIEKKTPHQLKEVAAAAQKEGCTHVTLTTGTPGTKDKGAHILAECTASIKEVGLPVHVQLEPVPRKYIEVLKEAGADTIGIHIETLDENVFYTVCPSKDFSAFAGAWQDCIDIFGENQVSSYVLIGLGEDYHTMVSGIESLVALGVIPFVVPFRPIAGTPLEDRPFPLFETVKKYSVAAAKTMKESGVNPFKNKAGCVRCGACSSVKEYLKTL
jgi:radical SAM protein (TIGR04043 family)